MVESLAKQILYSGNCSTGMSRKLRTEHPEAMCHVMNREDKNEPPQTTPQAQEVLLLCQ